MEYFFTISVASSADKNIAGISLFHHHLSSLSSSSSDMLGRKFSSNICSEVCTSYVAVSLLQDIVL
jgi:hypothetical protein